MRSLQHILRCCQDDAPSPWRDPKGWTWRHCYSRKIRKETGSTLFKCLLCFLFQIESGRKSARGTDVHGFKANIPGASSNQNMKSMPHRSAVFITSRVGYCSALEVWIGMMTGKLTFSFCCTHWSITCFKGSPRLTGRHNKSKARRLSAPTLSSRDHQSRRSFRWVPS